MIKQLPFDKTKIDEIAKTYPTPFHIYDEHALRERVRALKAAFSWNKGYREYYAVKACPNPILLQILMEEGCGLDCSSYAELLLAKAVGAVGTDIMFSANAMPAGEFVFARKLGAYINLDDYSHIDFLKENGGIPETVSCRFNPGEFRFGNAIMGNPAEAKFGFTREQLTKGFLKLQEDLLQNAIRQSLRQL
jgi:diaminopimelate decarboxylase